MEAPFTYTETTAHITVEVEPTYLPARSNPESSYYFYAYTIKITNTGTIACKLLSRHWIIRDGQGQEEHVRGEGVVGEQPVIAPGESFKYTSACPLRTPTGNMRGTYQMVTDEGKEFSAVIPVFFLRPPETFH